MTDSVDQYFRVELRKKLNELNSVALDRSTNDADKFRVEYLTQFHLANIDLPTEKITFSSVELKIAPMLIIGDKK